MKRGRGRRSVKRDSARGVEESFAPGGDVREPVAVEAGAYKPVETGGGAKDSRARDRRVARVYLIAALQAPVVIPLLYYLRFGEINAFALSFTGFVVVLCLLVALGFSIPDRRPPAEQVRADAEAGRVGRVGSFWLLACAFGPFFGWLAANGFTLTEENWRWRYVARLVLCAGLPVLTALPLLRYVRGRYWHVALLLLLGVTSLAAWSGLNTLLDLRDGPTVRRTTGLYDAPNNSFYPLATGKPFRLTTLAHTQRNIRIEPAPGGAGED